MSEDNNIDNSDLDDLLGSFKLEDSENVNFDSLKDYFGFDVMNFEDEFDNIEQTLDFNYSKKSNDTVDPNYAYPTDSGFDLYSIEDNWIDPNSRKLISTGLFLDVPEGYEVQVRSKSGLALNKGLFVLNSPGTVDQGYTGEIKVILFNTSQDKVKIEKGSKVAQAVLCPVVSGKWIKFILKDRITEKDRSDNGFGSTGI